MVGTLTARQEATDTVAVSARAATAKVRDVVIATAELLNEEQSRIWRPVEADIKERAPQIAMLLSLVLKRCGNHCRGS